MSPEDVALCQQAIELANSGQKQSAYEQFCSIYNHGNSEDVTLLYWIAVTTPSLEEAQRAMDTIARSEPNHSELHALQAYVAQKEESVRLQRQEEEEKQAASHWQFPILTCPYCHTKAPVLPYSKVSTAGCILSVILLLSVVGIPLCWIGLLMKDKYYQCSGCGILVYGNDSFIFWPFVPLMHLLLLKCPLPLRRASFDEPPSSCALLVLLVL